MRKKSIGQIPSVTKVIFEIRLPLCHVPIGFILEPKDFENRQFGVKWPHLVTLIRVGMRSLFHLLATSSRFRSRLLVASLPACLEAATITGLSTGKRM